VSFFFFARLCVVGQLVVVRRLLFPSKYITNLFERACLTYNKIVDTLLETSVQYFPSDGAPLTGSTLYRTIVRSLVYLAVTRPNIAHIVHSVSQFVSASTTFHWGVVLHILMNIWGTQF